MKLTLGMATFKDFDGVYFTIQSLRANHDLKKWNTEIIVIDNAPDSSESQAIKNFGSWIRGDAQFRYIPFAEKTGTSAPRNKVFEEATGDVVVCMDSHVLLIKDSLQHLMDFYANEAHQGDLVQGPLVYDDLIDFSTHFDDIWRSKMLGTWAQAIMCPCKKTVFEILQPDWYTEREVEAPYSRGEVEYAQLPDGKKITRCDHCKTELPRDPRGLGNIAISRAGDLNTNPGAFEIPAMGLGVFASMKKSWLGFNPEFRGFGGEEWYIHTKYRRLGKKAWCLPGLRWVHRFERPKGAMYPNVIEERVRNYVIGHLENGLPLNRVYRHFVTKNGLAEATWEKIVIDAAKITSNPAKASSPVVDSKPEPKSIESLGLHSLGSILPLMGQTRPSGETSPAPVPNPTPAPSPASVPAPNPVAEGGPTPEAPKKKKCGCGYQQKVENMPIRAQENYERWLETAKNSGDLLLPLYQEHAAKSQSVIEFVRSRKNSTVGFLSAEKGKEKRTVWSSSMDTPEQLEGNLTDLNEVALILSKKTPNEAEATKADILHIDLEGKADDIMALLEKFGPSIALRILITGTTESAEVYKDGPGILPAVRVFLKNNPEWTVKQHFKVGAGLLVLSRMEEDKKPLPSAWKQGWNFLKATARHAAQGFGTLDDERYEKRISLCTLCPSRNNDRCGECGCFIEAKASWPTESCPLGIWQPEEENAA
jgi:glycosyltransferase involved in cell wall biosynthesis